MQKGTGGWRRLLGALRRRRGLPRERAALASTRLFDPQWYVETYPDADRDDPIGHYLGSEDRRSPSRLFDAAWYLDLYPDVVESGLNPLAHYVLHGAAEGRDPNPAFASLWYRAANPEAERFPTPLDHYLSEGAAAGRNPSPHFDGAWYAERHPDAAAAGLGALEHYLAFGRAAGAATTPPVPPPPRGEPLEAARLDCFKPLAPVAGGTVALFVAFAPGGRLKPNVGPYVAALARAGVQVVLIVASDETFAPDPQVTALLAGGYVRDNKGFDFAAWAHLMRTEPSVFAADTLLLVNDSVVGPVGEGTLEGLLERVRRSSASVVGATESWEITWHLQSYFLAFKAFAMASPALHAFFGAVTSLLDKDAVIRAYEVTLAAALQKVGLECAAVFKGRDRDNQTVFHWRELLGDGFPFVKTLVLAGHYPEVDIAGWPDVLTAHGFDPAIAEATLAARAAAGAEPDAAPPPLLPPGAEAPAARPWKVAYIGPWNLAEGEGARDMVSALWRSGARVNLHPIETPDAEGRRQVPAVNVRDFEGRADVVLLDLEHAERLTPVQQAMTARARRRVGLTQARVRAEALARIPGGLDVVWTAGPADWAGEPGFPVEAAPDGEGVEPRGQAIMAAIDRLMAAAAKADAA